VEAFFPALASGEGTGFAEVARRHGDYALCGAGAVVRVDGDDVVSARVGYLSVCDTPTVVDVTDAVTGSTDGTARTDGAAGLALARLDPADDIHATAAYRAQLVRVLTGRVLRTAYDDAVARHRSRP
jgi:carbon-monoxide dehydrogenase medium subunit